MNEIAEALMALAAAWTGYEARPVPPIEIWAHHYMPHPQYLAMYFGQNADRKWEKIVLSGEVDVSTNMGKAILFHEMIHVLQMWDGPVDAQEDAAEWNRRERYAYRLTWRYLAR